MIFIDFYSPPPPKTLQNGPSKNVVKNEIVGFGAKTIFLSKERANGSPEAVQILFWKISKHMNPPTALFLHPKHAREKLLGGGATCNRGDNDYTIFSENGTGHFGALENFCQALSGD